MSKEKQFEFLGKLRNCCRQRADLTVPAREFSEQYNVPLHVTLTFQDQKKRTPIHYACVSSNRVIELLNWFPDEETRQMALRAKDKDGLTCLMLAVQHADTAVIGELLTGSKLALARSKAGATALHYAAGAGANADVIRLLYCNGRVALNTFALAGGTPLHYACSSCKDVSETIHCLMECGADVNASSEDVPPPLALALAVGNESNACTLLESEAIELSTTLRNGQNFFHLAVVKNLPRTLAQMLQKGLNVEDLKGKDGHSLVEVAHAAGNSKCVEILEAHGIGIGKENSGSQNERSIGMASAGTATCQGGKKSQTSLSSQLEPSALELKAQGNKHFAKKEWKEAISCYSKALTINPDEATLYANRSACLLKLKNATAAMEDADHALKLRPEWSKAYYRKAVSLLELGCHQDAAVAAYHGLQQDPSSVDLQKLVKTCVKLGREAHRQANESS